MKGIAFGIFFVIVGITEILAAEDVSICRKNIDHTINMTSGARELNVQCTEAVIKEFYSRKEYEVGVLKEYVKKINEDLKKYAVGINAFMVNCGAETTHQIEKVVQCRSLSGRRSEANARIDRLNQWESRFKTELSVGTIAAFKNVGAPPCPGLEFDRLKEIKNFDKELFTYWENCSNEK